MRRPTSAHPTIWWRLAALLGVGLILGVAAPGPALADGARSPEVQAQLGREAYDAGRYLEAVETFEALAAAGHGSGALYYDLGNAHYRAGHLGEAIAAYRRAQLFMPRDADLAANLEHLREETTDRLTVEDDGLTLRDLIFWYDPLTSQEQTWLALILGALAWGSLFLWRLRGRRRLPLSVPILFVAATAVTATALTRHVELTRTPGAVVVHPEITARSGTDAKSIALFYLHEGAEIRARGPLDGEWIQIELPDGRRGWVEARFIQVVKARP